MHTHRCTTNHGAVCCSTLLLYICCQGNDFGSNMQSFLMTLFLPLHNSSMLKNQCPLNTHSLIRLQALFIQGVTHFTTYCTELYMTQKNTILNNSIQEKRPHVDATHFSLHIIISVHRSLQFTDYKENSGAKNKQGLRVISPNFHKTATVIIDWSTIK